MTQYNRTNTCERIKEDGNACGNEFHDKALREHDKEGNLTGKWICAKCYSKYDPNSKDNIIKLMRPCRTSGKNPDSTQILGDNSLELACILYGWENLNKRHDNYSTGTPIDCYDPKTELHYQVQGRHYNSIERFWGFKSFEREWKKEYKSVVCICISKDGKIVERIYKFSFEKEIKGKRKSISIYKNPTNSHGNPKISWYDDYRIIDEEELKKANEIWQKIIS